MEKDTWPPPTTSKPTLQAVCFIVEILYYLGIQKWLDSCNFLSSEMFHKFLVHTDKRSVSWEAEVWAVWALRSGDFEDGLGVGQSWGGVDLLAEKPLPKALNVQDSRSPPEQCHLNLLFSSLLKCPYRGHVGSQRWWYLMGCFVGSDKKACAVVCDTFVSPSVTRPRLIVVFLYVTHHSDSVPF